MNVKEMLFNAKDFLENFGDTPETKQLSDKLFALLKLLRKGKKEKTFKTLSKWKDVADTLVLADELKVEAGKQAAADKLVEFLKQALQIAVVIIK